MKRIDIRNMLSDFIRLVYPELCASCEERPPLKDNFICLACYDELIFTDLHLKRNNAFEDHFLGGEITLERGASCFLYRKDSAIQRLLQQLKYKNHPEVGVQLGVLYGERLKEGDFLEGIDYLIPVPLFWKKKKRRGYNQSLVIVQGIHQVTAIPILDNCLIKDSDTTSQTQMTKTERIINVADTFKLVHPEKIIGKHLLIVDDVLTTGATIQSCARVLSQSNCKISAITIAMGSY